MPDLDGALVETEHSLDQLGADSGATLPAIADRLALLASSPMSELKMPESLRVSMDQSLVKEPGAMQAIDRMNALKLFPKLGAV